MKWRVLIPILFLLTACDDAAEEEEVKASEAVDVLYNRAYGTFGDQKYKDAIEKFEEVERQHPYSEWATRAQVMAAYSAYKAGEFEDAISIVDRFVKLHPTHPSAPYAYYLKALCYYTQITDVGRDQRTTEDARTALKDVMKRFPDTEYAQDAKLKLDLTNDHLAGKEMEIGRYYLRQQEYLAAINRFKEVVDLYETTSHAAEALHRLVECYMSLGITKEAKRYAAVLGHNYPGSEWYKFSYDLMKGDLSPEEKESIFDKYLSL